MYEAIHIEYGNEVHEAIKVNNLYLILFKDNRGVGLSILNGSKEETILNTVFPIHDFKSYYYLPASFGIKVVIVDCCIGGE